MSNTVEGIKAVNSVVRTLLMLVGAGVVGYGGWLGYHQWVLPAGQTREALARAEKAEQENQQLQKTIADQQERLAELTRLNERLQTSLKLVKLDRRMAQVKVLRKGRDEGAEGRPWMDVEFTEFDRDGHPIGEPRPFRLAGERLYVDCWLAKFEDRYIEDADLLRNATLCVFKGIWGDLDGPAGGQSLDVAVGQPVPAAYSLSPVTEFERRIWYDFWSVANSVERQRELGIRAAHGQVDYILAEEGQTYLVELRASDGVSLRPITGGVVEQ